MYLSCGAILLAIKKGSIDQNIISLWGVRLRGGNVASHVDIFDWINHVKTMDGETHAYFYTTFLKNGLKFPLPNFLITVLGDYEIALS